MRGNGRGAESGCGLTSKCEKLDRVASRVGAGVAAAFFTSLERCACINISTADSDVDEEEGDYCRPLMPTKFSSFNASNSHRPTATRVVSR